MRTFIAVALLTCLWPQTAFASDDIEISLAVDLPLTASTILLGGGLFTLRDEIVDERCAPYCDKSRIPGFERGIAGRYSPMAHNVGNVLVAVNMALPHLFGGIDRLAHDHGAPWDDWGEDTLLIAEALSMSIAIHQMTSFIAQRPRPFAYSPQIDVEAQQSPDTYLSFYSGHTANAFAVATAYSYLFTLRHPDSRWVLPVWTLTHGLAALQGYSRITAGYHFPSDVVVGAIIGSSIGLIVPQTHRTIGSGVVIAVLGQGVGLSANW